MVQSCSSNGNSVKKGSHTFIHLLFKIEVLLKKGILSKGGLVATITKLQDMLCLQKHKQFNNFNECNFWVLWTSNLIYVAVTILSFFMGSQPTSIGKRFEVVYFEVFLRQFVLKVSGEFRNHYWTQTLQVNWFEFFQPTGEKLMIRDRVEKVRKEIGLQKQWFITSWCVQLTTRGTKTRLQRYLSFQSHLRYRFIWDYLSVLTHNFLDRPQLIIF